MLQSPSQFDVSSVNGAQQCDWRHHSSSLVCVRLNPGLWARFCKVNLSNAKTPAWFFFQALLIYSYQELSWLLNVMEDDCQFLGVTCMRLSTRCKIWLTLGLFANYVSLKSLSLSIKVTWMCSKVHWILWNASLLFDLNYKFINESLAFSPG